MNTEFSPYEYLADNIDVRIKGERSIKDLDTAAQGVISYTKIRVLEVFHAHNDYLENNENEKSGKLGLMLSGGIDSVLLAAVLKDLGIDFHAVTVAAKGLNSQDRDNSIALAEKLNFSHSVVEVDSKTLSTEIPLTIEKLGTDELWEVLAALPISLAFKEFNDKGVKGLVLTGNGADAIFAGGKILKEKNLYSENASNELDSLVLQDVSRNFTRDRVIPDFYERVLGKDDKRFTMAFQNRQAWELSHLLAPNVLWTEDELGRKYDKSALRKAAEILNIPKELAWTSKSPLQKSSGLMDALILHVRESMARYENATNYTSPLEEDTDILLARTALRFHRHL